MRSHLVTSPKHRDVGSLNSWPIVCALAGSVKGEPAMEISDRPLRIEYCPVISAARDGVRAGSTRNCVSRNPSRANWSRRGVGAPRTSPPPYEPRSPYPMLSARMKTTFGFCSWGDARSCRSYQHECCQTEPTHDSIPTCRFLRAKAAEFELADYMPRSVLLLAEIASYCVLRPLVALLRRLPKHARRSAIYRSAAGVAVASPPPMELSARSRSH